MTEQQAGILYDQAHALSMLLEGIRVGQRRYPWWLHQERLHKLALRASRRATRRWYAWVVL
jgi:hypothetical protein